MSTETLPAVTDTDELTDLVETYATQENLPAPEWLSQYHLEAPQANLRAPSRRTLLLKRGFDLVAASTLLVLSTPVMALAAMLVWATSKGPVIFAQTRIGLNQRADGVDRRAEDHRMLRPAVAMERREQAPDRRQELNAGKPFVLYKFRTMCADAEATGARLAVKDDPRITPVGRLLRFARIDELPQLWNVLRGDMTLVGPRPERPEFIAALSDEIPDYLHRLRLKPGLTGLAQILNGYDKDIASFRRKVAFDLLYLQNCSVWNDIKICLRTVAVVVTGKGAL